MNIVVAQLAAQMGKVDEHLLSGPSADNVGDEEDVA
jgi:hypothetical protein